jgi:signal transduction histidine kinase
MAAAFQILIVDDNKNNLFTLRTLINEHIEANIIEADSGQGALDILLVKPVDLIILDVQMPEMDGFETAKLIRSFKKTRHIPIVFLTAAYKSAEFQQKGFAAGAADYLTKPIDAPQLISRINTYLRFIEQERRHHAELEQKVQERTAELLAMRHKLEERVNERTAELNEINLQLKEEIEIRKKTELAFKKAKEVAEQANLAKSQFLANMSHELRTPLNAIIGYSEILFEEAKDQENQDDSDYTDDLLKIIQAARHLLAMINDVLDLSKIEAGKMQIHTETFDLAEIVSEITSTISPLTTKNKNVLQVIWQGREGLVHSDVTKIRQILINLLGNASKFTDQGIIQLRVGIEDDDKGMSWVRFQVKDSGIGISPEQQAKLFQPFIQADASTTRKYGGTGLGLTISQHFTEMLGGYLTLDSKVGEGSTFTVLIPAQFSENGLL